MSYFINNAQKLNDIIFADRNKAYGAYAIRSDYGNTVFKSLSFMILGIGCMMSVAYYLSNKNNKIPEAESILVIQDTFIVVTFNNEEKAKEKSHEETTSKPTPPAKTKPDVPTISTVISSTAETTSAATVATTTGETSTLTITDTGIANTKSVTGGERDGNGGGGGTDTTKKISHGYEVDSECVFEGGLPALYRFISSNLKYPLPAYNDGKEGTVYVKFVVDEKGKVGQLTLLNSIGYGMDDEALRVVSLIPKFKSAAKVKGEPVKVYFQMPIRFRFKY